MFSWVASGRRSASTIKNKSSVKVVRVAIVFAGSESGQILRGRFAVAKTRSAESKTPQAPHKACRSSGARYLVKVCLASVFDRVYWFHVGSGLCSGYVTQNGTHLQRRAAGMIFRFRERVVAVPLEGLSRPPIFVLRPVFAQVVVG